MSTVRTPAHIDSAAYFELYKALLGTKSISRIIERPTAGRDLDAQIVPDLVAEFWDRLRLEQSQGAFLCIDSSPYYPAMGGQSGLPQTIYVSTRGEGSSAQRERDLFSLYFSNVLQTVASNIFVFFHPVLTGYTRASSLIPGHTSVVRPVSARARRAGPEFSAAYDWIMAKYQSRTHEDGRAEAARLAVAHSNSAGRSLSVYNGTVSALNLPDANDYVEFLERFFFAHPGADGRPPLDSVEAFQAMNAAYHVRFSERLARVTPNLTHITSFMTMFPVNLVPPGVLAESRGVPLAYRGGCWIYLAVQGELNVVLQRRVRAALLTMTRELWFTLSTEYNRRAADAIANLEKWTSRGAVLHQLPNDFASMGVTIGTLKEQVNSVPEPLRSDLLRELAQLDVALVQGMFLGAVTRRRQLIELPQHLAAALRKRLNRESVTPIFDKLVAQVAMQRVRQEPYERWLAGGWAREGSPDKEDLEEAAIRIDLRIEDSELAPGPGLYPLLLVALRNSYQHALVWAVLNPGKRGVMRVSAKKSDGHDVVIVRNTGLAPADGDNTPAAQRGMADDIDVFRGLTRDWSVNQPSSGQYVIYLPHGGEWEISIVRPTAPKRVELRS